MIDPERLAPEQLISVLEKTIPQVRERLAVPGLSAALFYQGSIGWAQGFGVRNLDTREPVTPQTVFEACSLSKPVVAYGALKLCDQGRLELDRPLAEYLPAAYLPDEPYLTQMTLRHVLSHSTGFPNWRKQGAPLRAVFKPGTGFSYSGEGYLYLQKVMEEVTGQALADWMAAQVLAPLNMPDSSFVWLDRYVASAAQGHEAEGQLIEKWQPQEGNAAYSLHTTVVDFVNFMLAVQNAPTRQPNTKLAEMLTPQIDVQGSLAWGLGWGLDGGGANTNYWHWGDNTWFTCFVCGWPAQQMGLVLMTNSVYGLQACREIMSAVLREEHPAFGWIDAFYASS